MKILSAAFLFIIATLITPFDADAGVTLKVGKDEISLYSNSYALLIGVSDYTIWPDLPGVKQDIGAVKKVLEGHGFNVTVLMDPTRTEFDKSMRQFIGKYGQEEHNRLLFYYAGHGYTLRTKDQRDLGYIVPKDTSLPDKGTGIFKQTAISMLEMEIYAKQIESKHALFLFDSCFSGSLFEITRAVPASISLKAAKPVRQFITAGAADQEVPDQSIFRRQFVLGLQGESDLDRDGYITGSELAQHLETTVINYSRQAQTPQYGKIRDPALDKGDFIFVSPNRGITANKTSPRLGDSPEAIEIAYWNSIKDQNNPTLFKSYLSKYPNGKFSELARIMMAKLNTDKKSIPQSDRDGYTIVELIALADSNGWSELYQHLADISPTSRDTQWQKLLDKSATHQLKNTINEGIQDKTLQFMNTALQRYPTLMQNKDFMQIRSAFGLDYYSTCLSSYDDQCYNEFLGFVRADKNNHALAMQAGIKVSRQMSERKAIAFFDLATDNAPTKEYCNDPVLKDSVMAVLVLDPGNELVAAAKKVAFGQCLTHLNKSIRTAIKSNPNALANACELMIRHKALEGISEKKCLRYLQTQN